MRRARRHLRTAPRTSEDERECAAPVEMQCSPILTLSKISKRFGAVVVADGIDLALAEGEALGIIGPNGAGKTTLFGIMTGTVAPDAGRVFFDGAGHHPRDAGAALPHGHRALVPDPAAVRRHDRVREPGGGGGLRRRQARARRLCPLRRAARAMRASPTRPTARPAASRCSTASGWSLRARSRPRRASCCSTKWRAA